MSNEIVDPIGPESPILEFYYGKETIAFIPLFLLKKVLDKKQIILSSEQEADWFQFTGRDLPKDTDAAVRFLTHLQQSISWEEIKNLIQPIIRPLDHLKDLWEKAGQAENLYGFRFGMLKTPSTLYRYITYSEDRLYETIAQNEIYLTSPRGFNDPFDCNYNDQVRLNLDQAGIACFTQIKDSVLLYSHYADKHKGICLMFAPYKMHFLTALNGQQYRSQFRPVYYFKELPEFDLKRELALIATCKDVAWSYEREWRMFIEDGKGGVLGPGLFEFPKEALLGIIFGSEISLENITKVRNMSKEKEGFSYIRAIRIPDKFGIYFKKIEYVL
jgi:hypothetical protein